MIRAALFILLVLDLFSSQQKYVASFSAPSQLHFRQPLISGPSDTARFYRDSRLYVNNDKEEELAAEEEEVRVKILGDRRKQIRSSLKAAESLRNFRIDKGERSIGINPIQYDETFVQDSQKQPFLVTNLQVMYQNWAKTGSHSNPMGRWLSLSQLSWWREVPWP